MKRSSEVLSANRYDPLVERLPFVKKRTVAKPIAALLKKDLYISFIVSSGSQSVQPPLFRGIADYYQKVLDYPNFVWTPKQQDVLEGMFRGMQMPKSHKRVPQYPSDNFWWMGDSLLRACAREDSGEFDNKTVDWLTGRFVQVDTLFSSGERRRFYGKRDPHESYFRTYVLLEQTTGSDAIDYSLCAVRKRVLGQLDSGIPNEGLDALAAAWESTHAGESFMPPRVFDL